jgi:RNase P/RNase MRP subunit POP5
MQFSLCVQSKQTKSQSQMNEFYQRRIHVRNGSIEKLMLLPELSPPETIRAWIPNSIVVLKSNCFNNRQKLLWISFESNSQLTQIESNAFSDSSLQSILIPSTVEILGSRCFSDCKSLLSISFESNSRLTQIGSYAFSYSSLQSILIPSTVQLLGSSCFSSCESLPFYSSSAVAGYLKSSFDKMACHFISSP